MKIMEYRGPTSTKTRIETNGGCRCLTPHNHRGPTSTKTRIETHNTLQYQTMNPQIADRHPLKQGLKLQNECGKLVPVRIADRHPLKQGLKRHAPHLQMGVGRSIADRHPLKQGLKHMLDGYQICYGDIADRHPLKQGLKHSIRLN